MKETRFIEQNKEKWEEFEGLVNAKKKDPDQLSNLFVEITDDLSFSKTYYPNRLVRAYLNNISQKIYFSLYKNRKQPFEKIKYFFTEDLPYVFYKSWREMLIAFLVFTLAAVIGMVSCINDPEYAEVVTSRYYVEMTKENIKNGDPMAVYKDEAAFNMFLSIAWNNLRVAYYSFVLGITACIGTIFFMMNNGTMLGGFQFFFYNEGMLGESALTIWQHGTIEILCIIIAGGAGLIMGRGLIFPGTYPRLQSLQMSAKRGLKVMIAITPLIVLAALIEAYITRLTEAPLIFRWIIILLSLAVMLGYFVFYPIMKSIKGFDSGLKYEKPKPSTPFQFSLTKIKSIGDIFSESFSLHMNNLKRFAIFATIAGIVFGFLHVYYYQAELFVWDFEEVWDILGAIFEYMFLQFFSFFKYTDAPLIAVFNVLMIGGLAAMALDLVSPLKNQTTGKLWSRRLLVFLVCCFFSAFLNAVFFIDNGLMYLLFVLAVPVIVFPLSAIVNDKKSMANGFASGISILFSGFFSVMVMLMLLTAVFVLFMMVANSSIVSLIVDFVASNFLMESMTMAKFSTFATTFISIFTFCMIFPIFFEAFSLQYHSLKETKGAHFLKDRIDNFEQT